MKALNVLAALFSAGAGLKWGEIRADLLKAGLWQRARDMTGQRSFLRRKARFDKQIARLRRLTLIKRHLRRAKAKRRAVT